MAAKVTLVPVARSGPFSKVFKVRIPDKYRLAMTFIRAQEWYESPYYHHKKFTLEEFMEWYSKTYGNGSFTYPDDWSGFNVPSSALLAMANMEGHSSYEKALLKGIMDRNLFLAPDPREYPWDKYALNGERFYVIGTYKDEDLRHELAHGRFFVDEEYRDEVIKLIQSAEYARALRPLERSLTKKGYGPATMVDECHAYVLDELPDKMKLTPTLRKLRRKLRAL